MRRRIVIRGTVQGVGFRPFVYNLARRFCITGFVLNTSESVLIEAEGANLDVFLSRLQTEAPVLSRIESVEISDVEPKNESGFTIRHSAPEVGEFALVPPDVATCPECVSDSTHPENRRFGYPFTNCTNCGPRYTIIRDIPYDRPSTTMVSFPMCPDCEAEYRDPANRRFHAQPNACPVCGPALSIDIPRIQQWLAAGRIVALKGIGGYQLACDATSDEAVGRLRDRKHRTGKPFALMAGSLEAAERLCRISAHERDLLTSPQRPIVLLSRKPLADLSGEVAPGMRHLGVMLPYTPLHHLLFRGAPFEALVMTSGNVSEEPIVSREEDLGRLDGIADDFVTHDRPIQTRVDDSVVRCYRSRPLLVRRSRGYAPAPVMLSHSVPQVLAVGGELKNTFCLTKGRHAFLSQHIGDLENYETLMFFRETLAHMKRFFRIEPSLIAHDLHPQYLSTQFALDSTLPRVAVQHHHAHIAACMAENHLQGAVIGVALDGTGYGTDGRIWGGEILVADYKRFERRYHFRYVPMAGGDAAVREPWRMALAYLHDAFGMIPDLPVFAGKATGPVTHMIRHRIRTVDTSSCGRLFDAVAALLGIRTEVSFEAQAAMELEALSAPSASGYRFDLGLQEIDFRQTIRDLVRSGESVEQVSARFHQTVANAVVAACERIRGYRQVCLSGGCFQNVRLLDGVVRGLERCGYEVYFHTEVPPNDGGISLGQAVVAAATKN